jgi:phosphatidylglycerol:prolipoprotein diacylglycerol transferase
LNLYAFLIGAGGSLAVWRVAKTVVSSLARRWVLAALFVLAGALFGARIGFVFWQPESFSGSFWQIFRLDQGGLVWFGALPGAWLMVWLIAKQRSLPFVMVADRMATMLPPMGIMTWLACWTAGCGYGPLLENGWWAPLTMDERGLWAVRLPLQFLAAISLFLIFSTWEAKFPKRRPGQRAALTWLLFSAHTLFFSFLRADPRPIWQGLAWDEWAALFFLGTALFFFLITFWPRKKIERYA